MTRAEFLNDLYRRLGSLSREQAEKHLTYYAEMLADRMEEGMSEAEAVASMEDLDTIVRRILQDEETRPPQYPHPPEAGPSRPGQSAAKKSGWDWRKIAGIALWAAAIAVVVSVLWNRFSDGKREPQALPDTTEEYDTGFHIDSSGIHSGNFSIGPDGIYASGGGHEVYIGPDGIHVDGVDGLEGLEEWAAGSGGYDYPGMDYAVPAEGIQKIEVVWTSGMVDIQPTEGDTIQFREDATGELTERISMIYETKGKTLTIRCWREGLVTTNVEKRLTLLAPAGLLDGLDVEVTSADVWVSGLELDNLEISSTSGDVALLEISARSVEADTTSGNVSGNVAAKEVEVETTSGDVALYVKAGKNLRLSSTSGDLYLELGDSGASEIGLSTTSGDAALQIPGDMGFVLEFETSSGSLESGGFSMTLRDGKYLHGGGGCEIEMESSSGDLTLIEG